MTSEEIRYPWQERRRAPWSPVAGRTPAERRRADAEFFFAFEEHLKDEPDYPSPLLYDVEAALFRFKAGLREGELALSREYADWEGLKEIGYFEEWGL